MIWVDIKQLAWLDHSGHRITGNRRLGRSCGAGYEKVHVATRLVYAAVLADEKQATNIGFLIRSVDWFGRHQGIECRRVL